MQLSEPEIDEFVVFEELLWYLTQLSQDALEQLINEMQSLISQEGSDGFREQA